MFQAVPLGHRNLRLHSIEMGHQAVGFESSHVETKQVMKIGNCMHFALENEVRDVHSACNL